MNKLTAQQQKVKIVEAAPDDPVYREGWTVSVGGNPMRPWTPPTAPASPQKTSK